jgi:hypothetical protein
LTALRPEQGKLIAFSQRQCQLRFQRLDTFGRGSLLTGLRRVTIRFAGRQRRVSNYLVRLRVGRLAVDRVLLERRTLRSGTFRIAVG